MERVCFLAVFLSPLRRLIIIIIIFFFSDALLLETGLEVHGSWNPKLQGYTLI